MIERDAFDPIGFLKLQGYVIQVPHWSLNPTYSIAQAAEALGQASGKTVRLTEVEALLMEHDIIIHINDKDEI